MNDVRLCIRLLARMSQSYGARAVKGSGIGRLETEALRHIVRHGGENQMSLAEHLGTDKAAVTRLVGRLEALGYIERSQDPADARAKLIFATPAAQSIRDSLISAETDYYNRLLSALPAGEAQKLGEVLNRMLDMAVELRKAGVTGEAGR